MKRCWRYNKRHLLTGLMALVFVIGTAVWIFTFPFHPSRVLRVIPPEASVVSWHLEPTSQMEPFLRCAPAQLLLAAGELSAEDVLADLEEPGAKALVQRLAGTAVVLGFAPAYGQGNQPAIFLGSWVGGLTTHLARGGWLDQSFEGFTAHRIGRDRIWTGIFPELPVGFQQVSFGVFEGVLAGCASSDPFAAYPLILALRRHGPLNRLVEPLVEPEGEVAGYVRGRIDDDDGHSLIWSGHVDLQADGRLTGHLAEESGQARVPGLTVRGVAGESAGLKGLVPLPEALPAALLAMPVDRLLTMADELPVLENRERVLLKAVSELAAEQGGGCVWVSGGAYSGRVMGLKVPGAGFAFQIRPGIPLATVATVLVDRLNAAYGMGLIAVPDRQNAAIHVLRPVRDSGGFAVLGADERPALALRDGWVIGTSNVGVLRRVLDAESIAAGEPAATGLHKVWLMSAARLPQLGTIATDALAAYALVRLLQTGRAERLDTPAIRRLLGAMDLLGEGTLRAGIDARGRLAVFFEIDGRQERMNE